MSEVKTLATTTRWFVGQWEAQDPSDRGWHTGVKGLSTDMPEGIELIDRAPYDALAAQRDEGLAREAELEDALDECDGDRHRLRDKTAFLQQRLTEAEKLLQQSNTALGHWIGAKSRFVMLVSEFLARPGCAHGNNSE